MSQISFKVSARMAHLIGQQNFSTAEGAVLELVKNSYDADAGNCIVLFDIPYPTTPIQIALLEKELLPETMTSSYLDNNDGTYTLRDDLDGDQSKVLEDYFASQNSIYIIDDGEGMDNKTIMNHWMMIGTGNKEGNFVSINGRVKTGAKGIGRFALDRLGRLSNMWTFPKADSGTSYHWRMDWSQFEVPDMSLSDINASLNRIEDSLQGFISRRFGNDSSLLDVFDNFNFDSGTVLMISDLKDVWNHEEMQDIFKSLESLIPPKDLSMNFSVNFQHLQAPHLFGKIDSAYFNDYDYRVSAFFDSRDLSVEFEISRNELDMEKVVAESSHIFASSAFPFDLGTLALGTFRIKKSVFEVVRWKETAENALFFREIGSFNFIFYFLKIVGSAKEGYPYLEVNTAERKAILNKFGGIKIFRDSFRVRPYGENGNDWLKLGERASQSTAGAAQRIGDWRVRPNQVAGAISISRLENKNLQDKSDRGSLIENSSFVAFKTLVTGIVSEFELDRSKVLNPFYLDSELKKKEKRTNEIHAEAKKIVDKIIATREIEIIKRTETFNLDQEERIENDRQNYEKILEKGFRKLDSKQEKDAEIAQVRNLASLGLIVASFAHELKAIRNNINEIDSLEKKVVRIMPEELKSLLDYTDVLDIIQLLKRDGERTKHWVDYSLTAIKKDKRKRGILKFENYFTSLASEWSNALRDRNVILEIIGNSPSNYEFKAFEMDMNTIFSNLISNSLDSFKSLKVIRERKIIIAFSIEDDLVKIEYSDNGSGLAKIFSDKEDIFLPFITSKKDRYGNDVGTGLGMYLVKNVVSDNNGRIEIAEAEIGFKLIIYFPVKKTDYV